LCNELLQLIPNLGNGETPVDCFYRCAKSCLCPFRVIVSTASALGFG
jgi:hypothetical protein